jgi:hypothetical protein
MLLHVLVIVMTTALFGDTKSIWVEKRTLTLYFSKGILSSAAEKKVALSILNDSTREFPP